MIKEFYNLRIENILLKEDALFQLRLKIDQLEIIIYLINIIMQRLEVSL